jgi:hypothetical protein
MWKPYPTECEEVCLVQGFSFVVCLNTIATKIPAWIKQSGRSPAVDLIRPPMGASLGLWCLLGHFVLCACVCGVVSGEGTQMCAQEAGLYCVMKSHVSGECDNVPCPSDMRRHGKYASLLM